MSSIINLFILTRFLCFSLIVVSPTILLSQTSTKERVLDIQDMNTVIDTLGIQFEGMYKYGRLHIRDTLLRRCRRLQGKTQLATVDQIKVSALIARLLWSKKEWKEAQKQIAASRVLQLNTPTESIKITHILNYLDIFISYQIEPNRKEAIAQLSQLITTYKNQAERDVLTEGQSYEFLARLYQDEEEYTLSNSSLLKAISVFDTAEYKMPLGIAYAILGANYDLLENFDVSFSYYEKSLAINEQLEAPNYNSLASTSFNLSLMLGDRLGDYNKAITYAQKALDYDLQGGGDKNPYMALDMNQLSVSYYALGDYSKATAYAEKAVIHAKTYFKNQPSRIAESLRALSRSYAMKGSKTKAIALGEEALSLVKDIVPEEHRWMASSYLHLANIYYQTKQYEVAKRYFLKAEKVSKAIGRDLFLIDCYQKLFEIYLIQKNYEEVPAVLEKQAIILSDKFVQATYFKRLNELNYLNYYDLIDERKKGRAILRNMTAYTEDAMAYPDVRIPLEAFKILYIDTPALTDYEGFISTYVSSRNSFPNQINQIQYANNVRPLFDKILKKLYRDRGNYPTEDYENLLFNFLETNKNTVLLNGIRNTRIKTIAGVPKKIVAREYELLDSLQLVNRNLYNAKQSEPQDTLRIKTLLSSQVSLEVTYENFQTQLSEDFPKLNEVKNLATDSGIKQKIQEQLKDDQAILQYFMGEEQWYSFFLTTEGVNIRAHDQSSAVIEEVYTLLASIKSRTFDRELSQVLYSKVLPEIPEAIDELIIITDGLLSYLPFETLINKEQFLVEKYAISYAGSLQLLQEQQGLLRKNNKGWIGFAPHYESAKLSSNVREVEVIQRITKGNSYVDDQATKEEFLSQSGSYNILHLATHTEIDPVNSMYDKMLFSAQSKEQVLTAAEVYGLDLKANLAVLSSCETGFGKLEKGEGIMSMSRAFTYAGVGSTLMTLWKIPDIESSIITTNFYESLDNGFSKNIALQQAKKAYLKQQSDPALKEPYFWAGFVLTGDISPIITKSNPSRSIWIVIVVIILVMFTFLILQKRKRLR